MAAATTTSAPGAGAVERMRHKLNSAAGKALSAARKRIGRPGYPPGIPRSRTPIADHRRPSMARVKSPAARPRAAPAAISRHSATAPARLRATSEAFARESVAFGGAMLAGEAGGRGPARVVEQVREAEDAGIEVVPG